jgi:hypothetical protein
MNQRTKKKKISENLYPISEIKRMRWKENLEIFEVFYLKFDVVTSNFDGANFEVNANRCDERFGESIVCKTKEERGLSSTRVADKKSFEEEVILLRRNSSERSQEKSE